MKIFVIEDDRSISKMVEVTLSIGGHSAVCCYDGKAALEILKEQPEFDLILLDVMLPGMDGFELLPKIRPMGIPVIFVTARQDVEDRVFGLKLGAEDYIVKPFHAMELLARVEVVGRRYAKKETEKKIYFKDLEVNLESRQVLKAGVEVVLTPKEYEVILFFLKHPNIAIRREALLSSVWGYEYMGESRTVDTHVQKVRKKLGLQDCLLTMPRIGYRLIKED